MPDADSKERAPLRFSLVIGTAITVMWCASMIVSMVDRSYNPRMEVHFLMMAVAGWCFGPQVVRRIRGE